MITLLTLLVLLAPSVPQILCLGEDLGREPGKVMFIGDSHTEAWSWVSKPIVEGTAPADVVAWLGEEHWATDGWGPPGCTPESTEFTDGTWCYGKGACCGNSSGDTITRHLDRGYPAACVEEMNASWATFMLGTNDLPHVAAEGSYEAWGDRLLSYVQGYCDLGVVPVVFTIPPRLDVPSGSVDLMNAQITRVATELGVPLVVLPLLPSHIGDDGVHITGEGYEIINELVWEAARELAQAVPAPEVYVGTTQELRDALRDAQDGTTIILTSAIYTVDRTLYVTGLRDLEIRAQDPPALLAGRSFWVVDDTDTILEIGEVHGLVLDGLTFAWAHEYGLKIDGESNPSEIHIRNCGFFNIGVRMIKGTAGLVDGGSIRDCTFQNFLVPLESWYEGGDYIGGIDMMGLNSFLIEGCTFAGIKGACGFGRAAVFVWQGSTNVIVANCTITDCDRGIAFGNPGSTDPSVTNGIIALNRLQGCTWIPLELVATENILTFGNLQEP